MNKPSKKTVFFSVAIAVLLLCSSICGYLCIKDRKSSIYTTQTEQAISSVALGGFKGIIADLLWLRLCKMQESNRLVELVELSSLITKLEPHSESVWTFHAWNLSYNISLLTSRPEDRWRWVLNGIELLRDKGLSYNPHSAIIAIELGWIFQHKIGMDNADINGKLFRTQWALLINDYLSSNGSVPDEDSVTAQELFDTFKMDVKIMNALEEKFGMIDWRCPQASSLYWAWQGLHSATKMSDKLRATRMVYTSLSEMAFKTGIITGEINDENWSFSSHGNHALIESTASFIKESIDKYHANGSVFMYINFTLQRCILELSERNASEAKRIYEEFKNNFPSYKNSFPSFEEFIMGTSFEKLEADVYNGLVK